MPAAIFVKNLHLGDTSRLHPRAHKWPRTLHAVRIPSRSSTAARFTQASSLAMACRCALCLCLSLCRRCRYLCAALALARGFSASPPRTASCTRVVGICTGSSGSTLRRGQTSPRRRLFGSLSSSPGTHASASFWVCASRCRTSAHTLHPRTHTPANLALLIAIPHSSGIIPHTRAYMPTSTRYARSEYRSSPRRYHTPASRSTR